MWLSKFSRISLMVLCFIINIGCSGAPYSGQDGLESCYELLRIAGPNYYSEVLGIQSSTKKLIERCAHDYYSSIH